LQIRPFTFICPGSRDVEFNGDLKLGAEEYYIEVWGEAKL